MNSQKFKERYAQLNAAQKEAVDWIEGPVMVIAGPGTGKTELLTLRIANILLKTQISPENVLALTFTESGVASMRSRLFEIVGSPAYRVPIYTFHGFCNEIIRRFPEFFPRIVGSQNITEVEQVQIIARVLGNTEGIEKLRPSGDPNYYVHAVKKSISTLKREGISVSHFGELLAREKKDFEAIPDLRHEKGVHAGKMKGEYKREETIILKNEELLLIYRAYEEVLGKERLYDFDDMIMEVSRAAEESGDLLLMLQEEYQYVLIDEHQDTNRAQNTIVILLMGFHESPNVFVVGDMKQAIFRFQGASEANFKYFQDRYPNARIVVLGENYRSTQTILNAAWSIIRREKLSACAGHAERPVSVYECETPESEEFFIAEEIKKRIDGGTAPESIAVLYRDNRDGRSIARVLGKTGIPYAVFGEDDAFSDTEARKLLSLFRAVSEFGSEEFFIEALHADFLGIPPLAVYELAAFARKNRMTVFRALRDEEFLASLKEDSREAMQRVHGLFEKLVLFAKNETFFNFFDFAIRESGFLAHLIFLPDSILRMQSLSGIFDSAREFSARKDFFTLADFMSFISAVREHGIRVKAKSRTVSQNAVNLMTAHKSKGMEFDYVYIVGVADGHWGGRSVRDRLPLIPRVYSMLSLSAQAGESVERDENEDERRLFFVALTRARRHVTISFPRLGSDGSPVLPARFVNEMDSACVERKVTAEFDASFKKDKTKVFAEAIPQTCDVKTEEFVRALFDTYGLSVTALNNYLACPWRYFYMNLLRVPKVPEPHQFFGIAVHAALKDYFDTFAKREVGEEFVRESFSLRLRREDLPQREFNEYLARGIRALEGYVRSAAARPHVPGKNEFRIGRVMLGDIPLNGTIDRLEFIGGRKVSVVDYKTGAPKSRNEILGETKKSEASLDSRRRADARRGNMIRQLVFYKLLLSLHEGEKHDAVRGRIDFIEPTESGKWRSEEFELFSEDVEKLAEEVKGVVGEIRTLAFWGRYCGDEKCEFCAVRKMMSPVREAGLGSRSNK